MSKKKPLAYISKLIFNNGEKLEINCDDIVIFVGPNNTGKSQALNDIYSLSERKTPSIVVKDIVTIKENYIPSNVLKSLSSGRVDALSTWYNVLDENYQGNESSDSLFLSDDYFRSYYKLIVCNLDTKNRLIICDPPKTIGKNSPKQHPIHYVAHEVKYTKWLSDNFEKTFNDVITPFTNEGEVIPLCIGPSVKLLGDYSSEFERQNKLADILNNYKKVHEQGDGIKSFTGILLYLMMDHFRTFIIDEPESFLHPPQARIMGQIIGETLKGWQQAFIATHSEDVIKGLLESQPSRIKLIRITREGDTNSFSILNNEDIKDFWSDPLLKHSNIMSSLFHKVVVICEGIADCQMYSIIERHLQEKEGRYSETLFVHSGGKHRMHIIAGKLRKLNVEVKLIADLDLLNNEAVFRKTVESFGIEWSEVKKNYNTFINNLGNTKEAINRAEAKEDIDSILDTSKDKNLSKDEIAGINKAIKLSSKWDNLKQSGISGIPSGEATTALKSINDILKGKGIHLVPVGELERFISAVGNSGPAWVNKVLEVYPNFDHDVYKAISEFIKEIFLENKSNE